ncbi:MAG: AAA family ATPase [Polyangiaceae bacterium]|nr:AAA family ATPase [Polyangiaceae bacterium]
MRLRRLELENFRGFERLDLQFDDRLTVLVGENGSGKSSILDALLLEYAASVLRKGSPTCSSTVHFATSDGGDRTCTTTKSERGGGSTNAHLLTGSPELIAFGSTRSANALSAAQRAPESRNAAEAGFSPRPDFAAFVSWFYDHENYENQLRAHDDAAYRDPELQGVRQAIQSMLPGVTSLRFDRARPGERNHPALVVNKGDVMLSLAELSDGERSLVALFAEIARRAAALSPNAPLDAPLVVLIDELDAHLHPRWQVNVIPRLLETFPQAQFVVTTHSPLVLVHVPKQSVRLLKDFTLVPLSDETKGRDARDLLVDVFQVRTRPADMQKRLDEVASLIDTENLAAARAKLGELRQELGPNDGDLIRLGSLLDFLEA